MAFAAVRSFSHAGRRILGARLASTTVRSFSNVGRSIVCAGLRPIEPLKISSVERKWIHSSAAAVHPLDPLSPEEIQIASATIKKLVEDANNLRFVSVSLKEPPKKDLLAFDENSSSSIAPARMAEVVTLNAKSGIATEYTVDLNKEQVTQTVDQPLGVQPMLTPEDCDLAEAIVQACPNMASILRERYNINDISRVACDPWSVHFSNKDDASLALNEEGEPSRRLVQTFLYYRQDGVDFESNHYSHPIDILPVVDLNTRQVVHVQGLDRDPPKIPTESVNYHRNLLQTNTYLQSTWRAERLSALNVLQPEGPSFDVDGNLVTWQKWSFRVGFNYREGLVLHNVRYDGRPIVFRASLVEMAVPYGDPHPPYQRKCAFDIGDYGLGYCANSLELGCDCLGHIHYFDATLSDSAGEPVTKRKAICLHEEDVGIIWKHVEYRNGHNESRRSRELVISSIATVVNYEYLFYWRLKQDGSIHFDIKLSGELSTNLLSQNEASPSHGVLVAPGVNAQVHQHMFCARLDMAVDGTKNTVSEIDMVGEAPGPSNPYGNAFGPRETVLKSEKEGIRSCDATKARTWKVSNAEGKVNGIHGKPVAYKLYPFTSGAAQPTLLVDPSCTVASKGAFATANLWVTPQNDKERFPAGEYTPQGSGQDGLPDWTSADRRIEGEDIVLWHAFGVSHVPRVEDFPVMPCEITGFALKPDGFFDGNPAIDLKPETNDSSQLAKGCCD